MKTRLTIICWLFSQPRKWQQLKFQPYTAAHVNALYRACKENIRVPHRFLCLTDRPKGIECDTAEIWPAIYVQSEQDRKNGDPGEDACYRRLHAFDPEWQRALGTEYHLSLDLDTVFLGDATPLIREAKTRDFTILRGSRWEKRAGRLHGTLCSWYNGSMWMCRAGARPQFWNDFDPATFLARRDAYKMPNGQRPHGSDQAWISVCAGNAEATWGPEHGVIQYRTLKGPMPENARVLFFAGRQKPWSPDVQAQSPDVYRAWAQYA